MIVGPGPCKEPSVIEAETEHVRYAKINRGNIMSALAHFSLAGSFDFPKVFVDGRSFKYGPARACRPFGLRSTWKTWNFERRPLNWSNFTRKSISKDILASACCA